MSFGLKFVQCDCYVLHSVYLFSYFPFSLPAVELKFLHHCDTCLTPEPAQTTTVQILNHWRLHCQTTLCTFLSSKLKYNKIVLYTPNILMSHYFLLFSIVFLFFYLCVRKRSFLFTYPSSNLFKTLKSPKTTPKKLPFHCFLKLFNIG